MENQIIERSNSSVIAGSLGALLVILGLILIFLTYSTFIGKGGSFWSGFFFIIGFALVVAAMFNITIGNTNKILLTNEFLRIEESGSYIRTAYWNRIDELRVSRYSVRIKYKSGSPERFPLPLLNDEAHNDLTKWVHKKSDAQAIQFIKKSWWKLV